MSVGCRSSRPCCVVRVAEVALFVAVVVRVAEVALFVSVAVVVRVAEVALFVRPDEIRVITAP